MTTAWPVPARRTYVGLFLVTLATVMYEIVLTRIFSVTMWYHFAFVAISVAMFGMTVGALVVYLVPRLFPQARVDEQLAWSALGFGVAIVVSFELHMREPLRVDLTPAGILAAIWGYGVLALPFVLSGVTVCLALTRFPHHVSVLYAADLAGAALACLLVIVALEVADGPSAVVAVAALATLGAACFAERGRGPARVALLTALVLACLAVTNGALARAQAPLLTLRWVKGIPEARPLHERWNSFSRITVFGDPHNPTPAFGWGLSDRAPKEAKVRQLLLLIDAGAGTPITAYDGTLDRLEFLRYDVTNVAHWIRRDAQVLVIGPGGGRDILSALLFEQRSVVGVEINGAIIDTVTRTYGDFTGHLDKDPRVTFVNDEARSWVARTRARYDITQVSLIDTWAATAAGAFVLSENSLYTVEAWTLFLDRLSDPGIFSVSRFYARDRPDEIYRLTTLASAALRRQGVAEPRRHVVIVRQLARRISGRGPDGVATVLVARRPFAEADLDALEAVAARMGFDVVLSPRAALDPIFVRALSADGHDGFLATFPVNIAPPTDDSPFFFHTLRFRDVFDPERWRASADNVNMRAVSVLGALLVAVLTLTLLTVIVPLLATVSVRVLAGAWPLLGFFASIGFGFMLVEVSQMQRLIVFLGHPTYGLSVVLFALLASSGLGSWIAGRLRLTARGGALTLLLLLVALLFFGATTPTLIHAWQGATTPIRVTVSVAILFPLGLLMGTAFPLGLARAATRSPALTPWLWGVNGATSVCGSVLALAIALSASISAAFWTGAACYAVALVAWVAARPRLSG